MLGSLTEADDALQDAWLRVSRANTSEVENLGGWLTTIVARVALNMLRSRTTRRQQSLDDVHLPDPIIDPPDGTDPEHEALLADSVGLALLVVLEALSPAERLAFVLHDMFAVPFDEIAPIVDRSPEATRQLASRARRRVRGSAHVPDADLETQWRVVDAFLAAHVTAISRRCSRSSTRMSYCGPTAARPGSRIALGALRQSPARRRCGAGRASAFGGRSSTVQPGWSRARWQAVLGRRVHCQERKDRRVRLPGRSGSGRSARSRSASGLIGGSERRSAHSRTVVVRRWTSQPLWGTPDGSTEAL